MNMKKNTPLIPISWGELIDKITILEIKAEKMTSPNSLENVKRELAYLSAIACVDNIFTIIERLKRDLKEINLKLWSIEDSIREKESSSEFDDVFIELARSIYKLNDLRAKTKRNINELLNSELVEEKSYADFRTKN